MDKYIGQDAAVEAVCGDCEYNATQDCEDCRMNRLIKLPAADVRPVVRGEWKKAYADHEAFGVRPFYRYCSKCHEATVHQYNFCPNCGADMRGGNVDA